MHAFKKETNSNNLKRTLGAKKNKLHLENQREEEKKGQKLFKWQGE